MKRWYKRLAAGLLTGAILVSSLGAGAYAESTDQTVTETVESAVETDEETESIDETESETEIQTETETEEETEGDGQKHSGGGTAHGGRGVPAVPHHGIYIRRAGGSPCYIRRVGSYGSRTEENLGGD